MTCLWRPIQESCLVSESYGFDIGQCVNHLVILRMYSLKENRGQRNCELHYVLVPTIMEKISTQNYHFTPAV